MLDDLDVGSMYVRVGLDEVVANDGGELLWWVDGVLLCENVGGLLLRVGRDDYRVVCLGVAGARQLASWRLVLVCLRLLNVSLEQDAHCLLDNCVDAGLGVLVDLVQADIILAVAGVAKLRHCDDVNWMMMCR